MIREKLGRIFSSRIFYICFSLLVAIALWLYVEITETTTSIYDVNNVPIVLEHEDLLSDRELLISSLSPDTVSLSFECTRSVQAKLNNTTVSVSVDLSAITTRGSKSLQYEINLPPDVDEAAAPLRTRSHNLIQIYVDRMQKKMINVEVIYEGGIADGFLQDTIECVPQAISVQGPVEAVSRVYGIQARVVRENLSSTYTEDVPFVLVDENGAELDETVLNQLTVAEESVNVTIPIKVVKEIPLTVDLVYGSGATDQNTSYTIEPASITIAGTAEDTREFNSINIGTLDLTAIEFNNTYSPLSIVVPNYLTNISGITEASVHVEILDLEMRHLSATNIQVGNAPDGYSVDIRSQAVDVRIRGRAVDMTDLTEANIRVVANIPTEFTTGVSRVRARVFVDGIERDIGAVGATYVTVYIAEETYSAEDFTDVANLLE